MKFIKWFSIVTTLIFAGLAIHGFFSGHWHGLMMTFMGFASWASVSLYGKLSKPIP
jgi:hypothetical protein